MPEEINKKFCKSASYYIQTCYLLHQPFFRSFFWYGYVVDKTGAGYYEELNLCTMKMKKETLLSHRKAMLYSLPH